MQELSRGQEIKHTSIGTQTWEDGRGEKSLLRAYKAEFPVSYKHPDQPAHTQTHALSALPRQGAGRARGQDRQTDRLCLVVQQQAAAGQNLHITQEHPPGCWGACPHPCPCPHRTAGWQIHTNLPASNLPGCFLSRPHPQHPLAGNCVLLLFIVQ